MLHVRRAVGVRASRGSLSSGNSRFENVQTNSPPGRTTRADVAEDFDRTGEVVDRDAADRVVERVVGERQHGIGIEVVHNPRARLLVGGELVARSYRAQ